MGTEFGLQPAEGFQNPNALYDDFSNAENRLTGGTRGLLGNPVPISNQRNNEIKYTPNFLNSNGLGNTLNDILPEGLPGISVPRTYNRFSSTTNNQLPGNNQFAEVTQMDLDRKNQFGMLDYNTAKDIGMISPGLTEEEFEGIKSGSVTAIG
jgi:hypothetical protein